MQYCLLISVLVCGASETRTPDKDSLANQRPPSQWKLDREARLEKVKAMKVAKAKKEHAARQYRLRTRQSAQSYAVRQRVQYNQANMYNLAEIARQRFTYQQLVASGIIRPPSCTRGRR